MSKDAPLFQRELTPREIAILRELDETRDSMTQIAERWSCNKSTIARIWRSHRGKKRRPWKKLSEKGDGPVVRCRETDEQAAQFAALMRAATNNKPLVPAATSTGVAKCHIPDRYVSGHSSLEAQGRFPR